MSEGQAVCTACLHESSGMKQWEYAGYKKPSNLDKVIKYVHFIGYVPYWHLYKTCNIMFALNVYDLTLTWSYQEVEGMLVGLQDDKSAKPLTAVRDCVSIFVSVKPLETWDNFNCWWRQNDISSLEGGIQNRHL